MLLASYSYLVQILWRIWREFVDRPIDRNENNNTSFTAARASYARESTAALLPHRNQRSLVADGTGTGSPVELATLPAL